MTRRQFDGGTYADVLADGAFAVLMLDHIITHLGRIELHEVSSPLYLRIANTPVFQIAGQASMGGGTLHYVHGQGWRRDPRVAHGTSGCIFDLQGNLHILEPAPHVTSQGYRYVDKATGRLVMGDETYGHLSLPVSEWTEHGDIVVGQGHLGGVFLSRGADRRLIEPGDTRFVRFDMIGDTLAIAVTKFAERCAVLHTFNRAEIPSFRVYGDPHKEPDEEPDPIEEKPKLTKKLPTDVHATFAAVVKKYPHTGSDDDRRGAMEKAVATIRARHGDRYVWKTEHSNLSAPSKDGLGFVPESEGAIAHGKRMKMFIWDMINGSTREPEPAHDSEPLREAYVLAVAPKDWLSGVVPDPDPDPEPDTELLDEVRKLQYALKDVQTEHASMRRMVVDALALAQEAGVGVRSLDAEVNDLKARPAPKSVDEIVAEIGERKLLRARGALALRLDLEVYKPN